MLVPAPKAHERLEELDVLRFVAAVMVVVIHYFSDNLLTSRFNPIFGAAFQFPTLDIVARYGGLGVDLFFMISGFVIAISAEGRRVGEFAASRFTRVFPTYWLAVAITVVLTLLDGKRTVTGLQVIANLVMQQAPLHQEHLDIVYWTLQIEVRFYVLVGLLIAFGLFRNYAVCLVAWAGLTWIDFAVLPLGALHQALLLQFAPWFIVGGMAYIIRRHAVKAWPYVVVAIAMAPIMWVRNHAAVLPIRGESTAWISSLVLMFLIGVVMLAGFGKLRFLRIRHAATLGALTYPLYLLHDEPGFVLMHHIYIVSPMVTSLVTIAVLTVAAWLVHVGFERPVGRVVRPFVQNLLVGVGRPFVLVWTSIRSNARRRLL